MMQSTQITDNVRVALRSLTSNRLRTSLTMLGIIIGVFAVILLVSVGQAVEAFVRSEFSDIGSNLVEVYGKASSTIMNQAEASPEEFWEPLTLSDAEAISDPFRVPDARYVAWQLMVSGRVTYEGEMIEPFIIGMSPEIDELIPWKVGLGREMSELDHESAARVVILGQNLVTDLMDDAYPLNKTIHINDMPFRVIGVIEETNSLIAQQINDMILMPYSTASRRLSRQRTVTGDYPVTEIDMEPYDSSGVDALIEQVRTVLREEHDLGPDDDDDFQIFSMREMMDVLHAITALLTVFLGVIASISLVVGGIGIMNIMLVTVTERTQEIGLRKAVGAQRSDIMFQFMIEAITLALVGGSAGTAFALLVTTLLTQAVPGLTIEVQLSNIMLAVMVSAMTGVFFGVYPAYRAASLNPIDALRYE